MINSVIIKNYLGDDLNITLTDSAPEHGILIKEITGLGSAEANINISEFATHDGGLYNSARLNTRDIQFTFLLREAPDIETSRQRLYRYFPIKKPVTIYFDTDNRFARIVGYTKINEPNIFSKQEEVSVTIECPDPYFYDGTGKSKTTFSAIDPEFEFPFENNSLTDPELIFGEYAIRKERVVRYEGDAEIGVIMHITASDDVGNITIYNFVTRESMKISSDKIKTMTGTGFTAADEIIISTLTENHYAMLLRQGKYYNILNAIDRSSAWFLLGIGDNVFAFTTDNDTDDHVTFTIEHDTIYEGI